MRIYRRIQRYPRTFAGLHFATRPARRAKGRIVALMNFSPQHQFRLIFARRQTDFRRQVRFVTNAIRRANVSRHRTITHLDSATARIRQNPAFFVRGTRFRNVQYRARRYLGTNGRFINRHRFLQAIRFQFRGVSTTDTQIFLRFWVVRNGHTDRSTVGGTFQSFVTFTIPGREGNRRVARITSGRRQTSIREGFETVNNNMVAVIVRFARSLSAIFLRFLLRDPLRRTRRVTMRRSFVFHVGHHSQVFTIRGNASDHFSSGVISIHQVIFTGPPINVGLRFGVRTIVFRRGTNRHDNVTAMASGLHQNAWHNFFAVFRLSTWLFVSRLGHRRVLVTTVFRQ